MEWKQFSANVQLDASRYLKTRNECLGRIISKAPLETPVNADSNFSGSAPGYRQRYRSPVYVRLNTEQIQCMQEVKALLLSSRKA